MEQLSCVRNWARFWEYVVYCSLLLRKTNRKPNQLIGMKAGRTIPIILRFILTLEARHCLMSKISGYLRKLAMIGENSE